jgi:hypothetical protein
MEPDGVKVEIGHDESNSNEFFGFHADTSASTASTSDGDEFLDASSSFSSAEHQDHEVTIEHEFEGEKKDLRDKGKMESLMKTNQKSSADESEVKFNFRTN